MNAPMGPSRSLFPPHVPAEDPPWATERKHVDVKRLLRRNLWIVVLSFGVVTLLSSLAIRWLPPAYVVTAKVLVHTDDSPHPAFFSDLIPSYGHASEEPVNRRMEDEMEMADLRPVAAAAAQKLGLKPDEVYQAPPALLLKAVGQVWDWFAARALNIRHESNAAPDGDVGDAVDLLKRSYSVGVVTSKSADTNSNIILFTLYGTDPDRAQRSLQAVLDAYIDHGKDLKKAAAEKAVAVATGIAEAARGRVKEAQARLDSFLAANVGTADNEVAQNRAVAAELDRIVRLRQQELVDVEHRLAQIETSLAIDAGDLNSRVVIEPPERPGGSESSKRAVVAAAASIGGLLLGVFLAGVREFLDRRLADAADVKASLGLPVLASLPRLTNDERAAVLHVLKPGDE